MEGKSFVNRVCLSWLLLRHPVASRFAGREVCSGGGENDQTDVRQPWGKNGTASTSQILCKSRPWSTPNRPPHSFLSILWGKKIRKFATAPQKSPNFFILFFGPRTLEIGILLGILHILADMFGFRSKACGGIKWGGQHKLTTVLTKIKNRKKLTYNNNTIRKVRVI